MIITVHRKHGDDALGQAKAGALAVFAQRKRDKRLAALSRTFATSHRSGHEGCELPSDRLDKPITVAKATKRG